MLVRRIALIVLMMLALLGAISVWHVWNASGRFRSDPAAARSAERYDRFMSPTARTNPSASSDPFASIELERSPSGIVIRTPDRSTAVPPGLPISNLKIGAATNRMRVGPGEVWLAALGVGNEPPKYDFVDRPRVRARFFSAGLRSITTNEMAGVLPHWEREVDFTGRFPVVKFVFGHTNLTPFKQLEFQVFDARTHMPLADSYSSSYSDGGFWYEAEVALWHQTPLEIGVTLATGPVQEFFLASREKEELNYPNGVLRLIAVAEGVGGGMSSSHDGKTRTIRIPTNRSTGGPEQTSFVFLSAPASSHALVDLEFLDRNGKALNQLGTSSSADLLKVSVAASASMIEKIRVRYYPSIQRLVFRMPELPGLPEQNRGLDNLFDVRIPYIRFEQEWGFIEGVSKLTQMAMPHVTLNPTNTVYPLIFTNTTTRTVFRELSRRLANPEEELRSDPATNRIEISRPPLLVFLEALRRLLSR